MPHFVHPTPAVAAVIALWWVASAASAADLVDGSKPLVCAATEVAGCVEADTCVQGSAARFNLPVLFRISLQDKVVESSRAGGERRTSPIVRSDVQDDVLVLHGADDAAVWIATIRKASGRMTVTAAREGEAYVVFGACEPR